MRKLLVLMVVALVVPAFAQEPPAAFEKQCAACHGMDGKAQTTAGKKMNIPAFSSEVVQKHSDEELFDHIANGVGHKEYAHAFAKKGMPATDIWNIVRFIRSFKKTKAVR